MGGLLSKNNCKYSHYFTIVSLLLAFFYLSRLGNTFLLCIFAVMENKISDFQAGMTIDGLSQQIVQVQDVMQVQAAHAVNLSLTARNWLIGVSSNTQRINQIWRSVTAKSSNGQTISA